MVTVSEVDKAINQTKGYASFEKDFQAMALILGLQCKEINHFIAYMLDTHEYPATPGPILAHQVQAHFHIFKFEYKNPANPFPQLIGQIFLGVQSILEKNR